MGSTVVAPNLPLDPTATWVRSGRLWTTAATALAPATWGTTYLVTSEFLPPGRPMFAALTRSLPMGLLALALTRRLPAGDWWWRSLVLGGLNIGLFFSLLFVTAERLPGGVAATVGSVQPTIVALLAAVLLRERWSAWRFGWSVVGVGGVGLVVLGPTAELDGLGLLAGLAAALSMAIGVTLSKKWGRPEGVGPTAYAGWLLVGGGLWLVPAVVLFEGVPSTIDLVAVGGYAWLAVVGGLVAYILWFRGIGRLPVTAIALLGLLSPVVATSLGVVVLGESLGVAQMIGIALTLVALFAGQVEPRSGDDDLDDTREGSSEAGERTRRGEDRARTPSVRAHEDHHASAPDLARFDASWRPPRLGSGPT